MPRSSRKPKSSPETVSSLMFENIIFGARTWGHPYSTTLIRDLQCSGLKPADAKRVESVMRPVYEAMAALEVIHENSAREAMELAFSLASKRIDFEAIAVAALDRLRQQLVENGIEFVAADWHLNQTPGRVEFYNPLIKGEHSILLVDVEYAPDGSFTLIAGKERHEARRRRKEDRNAKATAGRS